MQPVDLVHPGSPPLGVSVGADGYLRLTPVQLRSVRFVHLLSGLDCDPTPDGAAAAGATSAVICGYTEWATQTAPALSLGWDWAAEVVGRELRYQRSSEPRSNILLVGPQCREFDYERNTLALGLAVDEWAWQETVAAYVLARYA